MFNRKFISDYGKLLLRGGVVVLAFATIGFFALRSSHAATFATSAEAENGTLSGNATPLFDSAASGGGAVTFGTPSSGMSCALPNYPSAACTGFPANANITTNINGNYNATTVNQVIDGWHITGDLIILANNVTIKNSKIDGTVYNDQDPTPHGSFTISDTTIGTPTGCIGQPGINDSNYVATRVFVQGHDDGFHVGPPGNVTIRDSAFITSCHLDAQQSPPDGSHSDGIQGVCGGQACPGVVVTHNTFDLSRVPATFPINLNDPNLGTVTVNDNMILGGGDYLIDMQWHSGANWIAHNNRLVKDTWDPLHPYPATTFAYTTDGTCSHQDWQGNTIVTIDANYNITSTVASAPCLN